LWAVAYILAAATLWSTIGVASVLGGDIVVMAFVRSLIAGVVGLLIARSFKRSSLIAGVLLGVLFSSYPLSAVIAGVGVAAYLLYTAPLWATLASMAYGEKPGVAGVASVALILVAVALMGLEAGRGVLDAAGLASGLIAGVSYGLYIAVARFYSRRGESLEVSLGAMPYTLTVTLPMMIAAYAMVNQNLELQPKPIIAGAYLAVLATIIPYKLFTRGVEKVGASRASVIASIEPVLAAIWGLILFHQTPTITILTAYILITTAVVISSIKS
jgi:drug/metabolite transporter (DMT)-like permease